MVRNEDDFKISNENTQYVDVKKNTDLTQSQWLFRVRNYMAQWFRLLNQEGINSKSKVKNSMKEILDELDEWFRKREEENESNN